MTFAGEKLDIPAKTWDRLLNMLSMFDESGVDLRSLKSLAKAPITRPHTLVGLKNKAEKLLTQFSIVSVGKLILDPDTVPEAEPFFKNTAMVPFFDCVKPIYNGRHIAVTQGPCEEDSFCRAVTRGATQCKVLVNSEDDHFVTLIKDDTDKFYSISGGGGVGRIIDKTAGTGEKWAVVDLTQDLYGYSAVVKVGGLTAATATAAGFGDIDLEYVDHSDSFKFKVIAADVLCLNNCTFVVPEGIRGQAKPTVSGLMWDVECCLDQGS